MYVVEQDPVDTTVCEGQDASFTCVLEWETGLPAETRWFKNDVDLNMTRHNIESNLRDNPSSPANISSTVTVIDVTNADDGALYHCGAAAATSNNAMLNVVGKWVMNVSILENTTILYGLIFTDI